MGKDIFVERTITINKPKSEVFSFLKLVGNQEKFSVWNLTDSNKKTTFEGTDGTVGFIYSWDSPMKNVGAGSQEIKEIIENENIKYEIRFERPMKNIGYSQFIIKSKTEHQTAVIWEFRGPTKFPMSLLRGMFQKMLGRDIEQSLNNLKGILEK